MVNDTPRQKEYATDQDKYKKREKPSPFTKRILIVDDDPDITFTFKKAFEKSDQIGGNKISFHVNTYNDPLTALSDFKPRLL